MLAPQAGGRCSACVQHHRHEPQGRDGVVWPICLRDGVADLPGADTRLRALAQKRAPEGLPWGLLPGVLMNGKASLPGQPGMALFAPK
jgi:hypothetical protein